MKSGTSTLVRYLSAHPEIYIYPYEIHFFDDDKNYNKGLDWYIQCYKNSMKKPIIGEKTPTYSYLPKIPKRIAKDLPEVKLIWLFRNPVDRAYSNYWHAVKSGFEHLSFEKALKKEKRRLIKSPWVGYRERSIYYKQVKRFLEYFPKSKMLFLLFEELAQNPLHCVKKAYKFLNVSDSFKSSKKFKSNVTIIPRYMQIQWLARKLFNQGSKYFKLYSLITILNRRRQPGYPKLNEKTREALTRFFKPYNDELVSITGLEVKRWYK